MRHFQVVHHQWRHHSMPSVHVALASTLHTEHKMIEGYCGRPPSRKLEAIQRDDLPSCKPRDNKGRPDSKHSRTAAIVCSPGEASRANELPRKDSILEHNNNAPRGPHVCRRI